MEFKELHSTNEEIANMIGIEKSYPGHLLALQRIPKEFQPAIRWQVPTGDNYIGYEAALKIARLPKEEDKIMLFHMIINSRSGTWKKEQIRSFISEYYKKIKTNPDYEITLSVSNEEKLKPIILPKEILFTTQISDKTTTHITTKNKSQTSQNNFLKNIFQLYLGSNSVLSVRLSTSNNILVLVVDKNGFSQFKKLASKYKISEFDLPDYLINKNKIELSEENNNVN